MYTSWLTRIIKTNIKNDQMVFDRDSRVVQISPELVYSDLNFTSTFTPSCNWGYQGNFSTPTVRASPTAGTYCFLSEMMFQNGMNSFHCSLKNIHRDDWYVEMVRQVPEIEVDGKVFRLPVIVHANYCNAKTHELTIRGLWLYDENLVNGSNGTFLESSSNSSIVPVKISTGRSHLNCKAYNVSNVYFATKNFTMELENINSHRLDILKTVLISGVLVKSFSASEVYAISSRLDRQLIPDGDTFHQMGYEWDNVTTIPAAVLYMIPEGADFISTSTKQVKKQRTIKKQPV